MYQKIGAFLLSVLLLTYLGTSASAAEETGSIRVTLHTEGEVVLYCVGIPVSGGYRLTEAFGGGFIKCEDVYSPNLAQWLAETAEQGTNRILDADGSADFSRLGEGLYLLEQIQGETRVPPFLMELPYYGQWNIEAAPKTSDPQESPRTAQGPEPFLGATGMLISGTGLLLCWRKRKHSC